MAAPMQKCEHNILEHLSSEVTHELAGLQPFVGRCQRSRSVLVCAARKHWRHTRIENIHKVILTHVSVGSSPHAHS